MKLVVMPNQKFEVRVKTPGNCYMLTNHPRTNLTQVGPRGHKMITMLGSQLKRKYKLLNYKY